MLAPMRPTSTTPVSSGPSSVIMLATVTLPTTHTGTEPVNWFPVVCDVTAPPSTAMISTSGSERTPIQ